MEKPGTITQWLEQIRNGDASGYDVLIPLLYDELYAIARRRLAKERPGHTLGATALVNELYLKFVQQEQLTPLDRSEFMACASTAMRNILVDHARAKKRVKRGGSFKQISLEKADVFLNEEEAGEVLVFDQALSRLSKFDERASQVVQYRFFGGLTLDETAEVLGISKRSVQRSWTIARAWLRKEVSEEMKLMH